MPEVFEILTNEKYQLERVDANDAALRAIYARSRNFAEITRNMPASQKVSDINLLIYSAVFYIKQGATNLDDLKTAVSVWVGETAMDNNFRGFFDIITYGRKKEFTTNSSGKRKYTHTAQAIHVSFTHEEDYNLFESEFMVMMKLADT